jgi:hypothetical protein
MDELIGKLIWFDYPTTMGDIRKVYDILVSYGFKPYDQELESEYLNELYDFIYESDNGFFHLIQHNSSLLNDEERIPYIDYGKLGDYDFDKENPKFIYYEDFMKKYDVNFDETSDIFSKLNESNNSNTNPKVGDVLYCIKNVVMDDGDVAERKGKSYEIRRIKHERGLDWLTIKADDGMDHEFSFSRINDSADYRRWFILMGSDIDSYELFDSSLVESIDISKTDYTGLKFESKENEDVVYTFTKKCKTTAGGDGYEISWQVGKHTLSSCYAYWMINNAFNQKIWNPLDLDIDTEDAFDKLL